MSNLIPLYVVRLGNWQYASTNTHTNTYAKLSRNKTCRAGGKSALIVLAYVSNKECRTYQLDIWVVVQEFLEAGHDCNLFYIVVNPVDVRRVENGVHLLV